MYRREHWAPCLERSSRTANCGAFRVRRQVGFKGLLIKIHWKCVNTFAYGPDIILRHEQFLENEDLALSSQRSRQSVCHGNGKEREKKEESGNFYYFSLITKLQRSLTALQITMNSTSADKQKRTGSSSSQLILFGFDVMWR